MCAVRTWIIAGGGAAAAAVPWLPAAILVPMPIGAAAAGAAACAAAAAGACAVLVRALRASERAADEAIAALRARDEAIVDGARQRLAGVAIRIEALEPLRENAA